MKTNSKTETKTEEKVEMKKKFILLTAALLMCLVVAFALPLMLGPSDPAPASALAAEELVAEEVGMPASLVIDQATINFTGIDELAVVETANVFNPDVLLAVGSLTTSLGIAIVLTYILLRLNRTTTGTGTLKTRVWRLGAAICLGGFAA